MEQDTPPQRLSIKEAAARAGVSINTIKRAINKKLLKSAQVAPHHPHKIDPAEVDRCYHLGDNY